MIALAECSGSKSDDWMSMAFLRAGCGGIESSA